MTNAEIRKMVTAYFDRTLEDYREDAEDSKADGPVDPKGLSLYLLDLEEELADGNHVRVAASVADSILEGAGIKMDREAHDFRVLCREVLKGIIAGTRLQLMSLRDGRGIEGPADLSRATGAEAQALAQALRSEADLPRQAVALSSSGRSSLTPVNSLTAPSSLTLSALIREYIEDKVRGERWRGDRTRVEVEGVFGLFVRIVGSPETGGDKDVRALQRRDFTNFRDVLLRWPSNVNKKARYRGLSVKQVLEAAIPPLLSKTSVNQHLSYVSGLMKWAVQNQYTGVNLAEGLAVKKDRVKDSTSRKEYDEADLHKLFASPIYTTDLPKTQPERYWIPLSLLFSGLRLNEAAGLRVVDVREVDGVLCFDISEEGERHLKNASSQRIVPVHSILIGLGLREYVKAQGRGRLFPNLKKRGESFGVAVSRWWGRYGRQHVSKDKKKSLHSFRHAFTTALNRAHVPAAVVNELTGHAHGNIDLDRYGHGFEVGQLKEAIEKLNFGIEEELRKLPKLPLD